MDAQILAMLRKQAKAGAGSGGVKHRSAVKSGGVKAKSKPKASKGGVRPYSSDKAKSQKKKRLANNASLQMKLVGEAKARGGAKNPKLVEAAKNSPWLKHVREVRAANPSLIYKEALQLASASYVRPDGTKPKKAKKLSEAKKEELRLVRKARRQIKAGKVLVAK